MSSPVIYSAFEPANVSFGKADVMRNGGKIVNLSYPGSRRIQLQTPTVSLPFGVNEPFKGGNGGDVQSYSVDLRRDPLLLVRSGCNSIEPDSDRESATWYGTAYCDFP